MGGVLQISLAYQGGGARVVELMAAAKACQDAEKGGRFKVVRVSGASAGAIAAAMHATGCDIAAVAEKAQSLQADVLRYFPPSRLQKRAFVPRILLGKAIYDEKHVRELILRLFKLGGVDAERSIRDIALQVAQLRIMRSDIRFNNASAATETSEARLVDALVDSAAIPFAFRVPGVAANPEILDGGLFQNLPASAAMENLQPGQIALGFSFPKEDAPDLQKASFLAYGKAVLSSLLDERIADATQRIKPSNVIEIPNRRSLFEFAEAFSSSMRTQFSEDVSEIGRRVENWVRTAETMDGPDWHSDHPTDLAEQAARTQTDVTRFYEEVCDQGYHATAIHHDVVYQSFNKGMPDIYTLTVELSGSQNVGLQFLRFFFYDSDSGPIKKTSLEIFDAQGNARKVLTLPLRVPGKRIRGTLVCLDRPLLPDDVVKVVKVEESFDGMLQYESDGYCSQTVGLSPFKTADRLTITVHFPMSSKPLHFGDASPDRPKDAEMLAEESGLQLNTRTTTQSGRRTGCRTVVSEVEMTGSPEQRRFVKVVYYRS
jgi:predicted acylesterase/phospholipase RssA